MAAIRIKREIGKLEEYCERNKVKMRHLPIRHCVVISDVLTIDYGEHFPFEPPKVRYDLKKEPKYDGCVCMANFDSVSLEDLIGVPYTLNVSFA